jgi:hypothetical protein
LILACRLIQRLWVINLATGDILFHSLVAHGRNTGDEFASNFQMLQSPKSSLGFMLQAKFIMANMECLLN